MQHFLMNGELKININSKSINKSNKCVKFLTGSWLFGNGFLSV